MFLLALTCACQVLRYLQAFAAAFQLHQYVTFDTEVIKVTPLFPSKPQQQERHQGNSNSNGSASPPKTSSGSLPWPKWHITTQPVQHCQQSNSSSTQQHTAQGSSAKGDDNAQVNGHLPSAHEEYAQPGSDRQPGGESQTTTFEALVVCNGQNSAPRCPDVRGSESFPGTVMHSHNYRESASFVGQTVVLVGASASGEDICREIAEVADKVNSMPHAGIDE